MTVAYSASPDQLLQEGEKACKCREFRKAKRIYKELTVQLPLQLTPLPESSVEVWNNLGAASCELDEYRDALEAYSNIPNNQRTADTWYNIALANYYVREYKQALECVQSSVKTAFGNSSPS
jgi:tetratricopeptide (TPR) repeat protein